MDSFFIANYMPDGSGLYGPADLINFNNSGMITEDTYDQLKAITPNSAFEELGD